MKKHLLATAAMAAILLSGGAAHAADVNVDIGLGGGSYYSEPAPAYYYQPAPRTVYYPTYAREHRDYNWGYWNHDDHRPEAHPAPRPADHDWHADNHTDWHADDHNDWHH